MQRSWTETKRGELFWARAIACTTPLGNTVMLRWLMDELRQPWQRPRFARVFRKTACIREVAGRVFPSWQEGINLKYNHIEDPTISIPFHHFHHATLGPQMRDGNPMEGHTREHYTTRLPDWTPAQEIFTRTFVFTYVSTYVRIGNPGSCRRGGENTIIATLHWVQLYPSKEVT